MKPFLSAFTLVITRDRKVRESLSRIYPIPSQQ